MSGLDPVAQKLLHSTQSAIPFDLPFWERLAHGLFVSPGELADLVGELSRRGVLLGFQGELNPDLAEAREGLVEGPPPEGGALVRWSARSARRQWTSVLSLGEAGPPGWRGERCLKCGGRLRPEVGTGLDLLAPDPDRTTRVSAGERPRMAFAAPLDARVAEALLRVRPLDPPETPWEGLAQELGMTAESVVASARRLVAGRVLRRVAFRFSARGLGFAGCALAGWGFDSEEDLAGLAGLVGAADVFLRARDPQTGANLACLLLGRDAGSGVDAAGRIGAQWGVPPVLLEEVELG